MAINSRKAPLFNSRRLVRKFTNAVSVQFTLYYISLCRRQNIAFVRTYRAPSGAYHNAVILLSLLFGAAKRSRRISYPQARKRDSSLRIRSIQNDSIRHAYNICCMRKDRYHIWHNFNLFRNDCLWQSIHENQRFSIHATIGAIHESHRLSIH